MIALKIAMFLPIGLLAGFLAGLLGIGGGLIIVPSLLYYFSLLYFPPHIQMQFAIGTSLATITIATLSAGISHYRKKAIDFSSVYLLGIGNIGGAFCGAYLTGIAPSQWLQVGFGLFEALMGVWFFFPQRQRTTKHKTPPRWTLIGIGFFVATLATLLGIGGGLVQVPVLTFFGLSLKRAIGTASVLSFLIALFGSISLGFFQEHLISIPNSIGFIYLPAFLAIGLAAALAAPFGAKLVHFCPTKVMRKIFSIILLIVGALVIFTAWK